MSGPIDSRRDLTACKNAPDSAPSLMRWSKAMQMFIMDRMAMASSRTIARFCMASVVRIAAWGWLMMG